MTEEELLQEAVGVCRTVAAIWPRNTLMDLEARAQAATYLQRIGRVYRAKAARLPPWYQELFSLTVNAKSYEQSAEECAAIQRKHSSAGATR
jgi:hypothetical protein